MTAPYGLIADLHLHPWTAFSAVKNGMNSRLQILHESINETCRATLGAGGKHVVMAGDIFHVRGSVSPTVLNSTKDLLESWNRKGIAFIVLPGNHDLEGKESSRLGAAVTALEMPGVRIYPESHILLDLNVVVVPWFESVADLKVEIERIKGCLPAGQTAAGFDLVIHAPIDGVIFGLPAHGLDAATLAGFGFKRVFAGHYHDHKDFGNGVYSIGALAHHTWSDVGTTAGFLLVYDDKVVQTPTSAPLFIDATSTVNEDAVKGNYVRAQMKGSITMKQVAALRTQFATWGALGSRIDVLREPTRTRPTAPTTGTSTRSVEQSIAAFVPTGKPRAAEIVTESLRVLSLAG